MRRAIALASVTLTVKQYEKDGVTHIDCTQVATGGITSIENRTLDWELREDTDKVFGEVKGKSRWVKLKDVDDDDYLKTGYDDLEGEHVQAWTEGKKGGWTANQVSFSIWILFVTFQSSPCRGDFANHLVLFFLQVWGFEIIQGKRYYVRHTMVRKGDDWKEARLVYDWQG